MSGGAKGIGLGIDFAIGNQYKRKGGKSYIDPAVLSSVVSVISTYGKTNEDADRSILKDKTGKGNDFKLLNFGFAGNSGYGLYSTDFTKWTKRQINDLEVSPNKISVSNKDSETGLVIWLDVNKNRYVIPSYKIKVSKLTKTITYYYIDEANPSIRSTFSINKEGTYILPISRNDLYNGEENTNIGFGIFPHESFTIEQLPDFEGWLCTDGVDDIIESVKPVSEMLEGSNEITVVSIIHQISQIPGSEVNKGLNNQISYYDSPTTRGYLRNNVKDVGKTGIYGYTFNGTAHSVINNILGDKGDYIAVRNNEGIALNGVFSVCGYKNYYGELKELSSIAYAGGFIANKVLTTDEINQIIAYFNLDRPGQIIKPQLYCNVKKQGITNDNHAEFNDQLIDFVGGRNIQLNNVAWKEESGIGKYNVDFDSWIPQFNIADSVHTSNKLCVTRIKNPQAILYTRAKVNSMKVEVKGSQSLELFYQYVDKDDNMILLSLQGDGIYDLPASIASANNYYTGFRVSNYTGECDITITQIPENPDALHLDGISDFGKATGLPVLKDYTVVADRKILGNNEGGTLSKSYSAGNGAFIFETGSVIYSFGTGTSGSGVQSKRMLSYLSKYIYNGNPVQAGAGIDSDSMWLGTLRDGDPRFSKFALWSLMLFSYTLSEFLLERQLKKYNAGTLYPGMVEFRPIVKSNIESYTISFYLIDNHGNQLSLLENGKYYDFSDKNRLSLVKGVIKLDNEYIDSISSVKANGIKVDINDGSFYFPVTKSPQKIDITIDRKEVLSNIKNSTWISNEQLIKNK
jgi:hypothetical protein